MPRADPAIPDQRLRIFDRISSDSGKRSDSCLEKIISPSTTTSKIPPPPQINSDSTPVSPLMVAAKLVARGKLLNKTNDAATVDGVPRGMPQEVTVVES